jgi:hypothetical protein
LFRPLERLLWKILNNHILYMYASTASAVLHGLPRDWMGVWGDSPQECSYCKLLSVYICDYYANTIVEL